MKKLSKITKYDTYATVTLTRGYEAMIDIEDITLVDNKSWTADFSRNGTKPYARFSPGGKFSIRMHRLIINASEKDVVDHINGNTLDNRKSNLRLVTISQNLINTTKRKGVNSSSIYKGVRYVKNKNRYQARITVDGKRIYLGQGFLDEKTAALKVDEFTRKHHAELGRYNFPREGELSALEDITVKPTSEPRPHGNREIPLELSKKLAIEYSDSVNKVSLNFLVKKYNIPKTTLVKNIKFGCKLLGIEYKAHTKASFKL